MLASMRRAMDKGLLQVVAWVTAISMVLFFSGGGVLLDNIVRMLGFEKYVISINGNKVTVVEFEEKVMTIDKKISQINQLYGAYAPMLLQMQGLTGSIISIATKQASLDLLTNMILKKFNVKFDSAYRNNALVKQLPKEILDEVLDENGKINMEALQYALGKRGYTLAELEYENGLAMKNEMALNLINSGLFIPKFLVKSKIEDAYGLKKYAILSFNFEKYLKEAKSTTVSQDELKSYYENNKNSYIVPENRSVSVWTFNPANYGANISDKEVSALYERNKQKYLKEPAKIQLRRLLLSSKLPDARQKAMQIKADLIKNPAKFADFVKEYSDDKSTVAKGGLLDFVKQSDLEEIVGRAAFALENDGDISDILTTPAGLEILQRVARKPAAYKSLSDVEKEIKESLVNAKFNTNFNLDAKRISKENKKNPAVIEEFAKQKKAAASSSKIEKNNTALAKAVFNLKEGALGYFVENNTGYIVKLNSVEKSHLPAFATIEGKVKEDVYKEKALGLMKSAMQKAQAEMSSASPKDIATKLDAILSVTGFINTESKDEISSLSKQNIPTNELLNLQKRGVIKSFINNNQGFVVKLVETKELKLNQPDDEQAAARLEIEKNLYLESRDALDKGFIASLLKNAKIVINDEQFNQKKRK